MAINTFFTHNIKKSYNIVVNMSVLLEYKINSTKIYPLLIKTNYHLIYNKIKIVSKHLVKKLFFKLLSNYKEL